MLCVYVKEVDELCPEYGILDGVLRDAAYKLKKLAEEEKETHKKGLVERRVMNSIYVLKYK